MKRFLALILSAALCIGLFPVMQAAAADVVAENVAPNATLYPSSTMGGYSPASVNDGNIKTIWARGNLGTNEHMMFDLGEPHRITSVVIHPRPDIADNIYRQRVAVEFSNTPDFAVKERIVAMGDDPTPFGEGVEVNPSKTAYRYVRVIKMDIQILVLAEVEIFGFIPDPNATELGEDVAGSFCEGPVTLLSNLEIMENVNDEIFGIDHLMTRGEAAEAVARMALGGVNGFGEAHKVFSDVPEEHKNFAGISAAHDIGIISGDGDSKFRPDDYVTETELIYMTMRAIGYSEKILGSPSALMGWCDRLDILDNVEGDEESGLISRGNAAIMLYNALLAPTIEMTLSSESTVYYPEGENTLYKKHGITLTEGVVNENSITRLDGNPKTDEYAADISGTKFVDKTNQLKNFLGREVIVATHKSDKDNIVLAWQTYEDEVVELSDSELVSTVSDIASGTIITETENGKERKYALDKDVAVVVNGYADPYWEKEDLVLCGGSLTLVNNDKDSAFDVVFVNKYSLHKVASVVTNDENVTVVNTSGEKFVLDKATLRITDPSGKSLSASKIKKDTLVKIYNTPDGKNAVIAVYSDPVTGKLNSKSTDGYVIEGEKYTMSAYYEKNKPANEPPIGSAVLAFAEEDGEILWMEEYTEGSTDWIIGFSQVSGTDGVLETSTRMKIFDQSGKWNIYEVADKIRVDGAMRSKTELAEILANAKNSNNWVYEKSFIRYKLNGNGKIREIDTTVENENSEFRMIGNIASGLYSKESGAFWSEHKQVAAVKENTTVFVIPTVGGQYTTDTSFDDVYRVAANVTSVAGNRSSQTQNIDMFLPDDVGMPSFMVKKENYSASTGGLASVTTDNAPNIIVEEIEAVISDSEIVYNIKGKNLSSLSDESFVADENLQVIEAGILYQEKSGTDCFGSRGIIQPAAISALPDAEKAKYLAEMSEIGTGDIIRFETLNSKARAVERVFDFEPSGLPDVNLTAADAKPFVWFAANGSYPDHYIAFNRYQFGDITEVTADTFTVTSLKGVEEQYFKTNVPKILLCSGSRALSVEEAKDLYEFTDGNYKVMVFSYNATPKAVVVYEYAN